MSHEDFHEVTCLHDPENIIAVPITMRELPSGERRYSCAFQREYVDKDGEVKRTYWLNRSHLIRLRNIIDEVVDAMDSEEEKERLRRARDKKDG